MKARGICKLVSFIFLPYFYNCEKRFRQSIIFGLFP
jgi:hypothetical protein